MPDMQFVDSSNIEAIGYDNETFELHVRFLSSGVTYVYWNVEEWLFQELMAAPSKGEFLNQRVKGVYDFAKL